MNYSDVSFSSPLTKDNISKGQNRALLLQFILSELFHANHGEEKEKTTSFSLTSSIHFFPFDWSYEKSCNYKLKEHGKLLKYAFPKLKSSVQNFHKLLEKEMNQTKLKALYEEIQPFLIACNQSENLVVFLLKNASAIAKIAHPENLSTLLKKMFPAGLQEISHLIKCEYQNRGLDSHFPEIEKLLAQYE